MQTNTLFMRRKAWLVALVAWVGCVAAMAQPAVAPTTGVLAPAEAVGEVTFSRGVGFAQLQGASPRTLGAGLPLQLGDRLTTAAGASAIIRLNDGTRVTLRPQSDVMLQAFKYVPDASDNNMVLQLLRGGFRALTGLVGKNNSKAAMVKTPTATIGIRGTDFDARLCQADCASDVRASAAQLRAANLKASAKAVAVTGSIVAMSDNGDRRTLVHGSALYPGDLIETATDGRAVLAFRDESKVSLAGGTRFRVDDFVFDRNNPADGRFLVTLLKGTARALTGLVGKARASNVLFKTPTATIGIRGTG
ncbi:MAG: FecR domain-containing protein, partial [Burkholderiales bacterium]|nr:FecR domain-containing protein [Burkholderiales bacterium]